MTRREVAGHAVYAAGAWTVEGVLGAGSWLRRVWHHLFWGWTP